MLSVLLNWCYIGITTFLIGFGFFSLEERLLGYSVKRLDSVLTAGLIAVTVYAQFFSLFGGVGLAANLGLLFCCGGIGVVLRRRIADFLRKKAKDTSVGMGAAVVLLCLIWAFAASRGYMMYDTALYHAQSIRWIEEYGVVKGLGNLHERFAYNSSFFALTALYSMKFLLGRSLHTLSGYFALLLSAVCLRVAESFKRKRMVLSDYARIGAVYYLTTICDEVVSPASDYSIMCMIFYLVIKWLDLLEEPEKDVTPYCLLCVGGVYAMTLKLTAGLILILVVKPAAELIRERRLRQILLCLGMGLLVAFPWFVRTVVISGYLLYPFAALDLFGVDWKMRGDQIAVDAAQIKTWGRGLYNAALADVPVTGWFGNWFGMLSGTEKLLILADLVCLAALCVAAVRILWKKRWGELDRLLVVSAVAASYGFWQLSAPLMRYGYAYVLLLAALMAGWLVTRVGRDRLLYFGILLYGCYKLYGVGMIFAGEYLQDYYVWQQDYESYELREERLGPETVYVPVSGDRTGYDPFPSVPVLTDIELRGEDFSEGFRPHIQ